MNNGEVFKEVDDLIQKKNTLTCLETVLEAHSASSLQESPVFVVVTIFPLFSQLPLPPFGGGATGRDSLESKVTFIQLSEWVSLLECITDKDFYSAGNSPESGSDSP